MHHRITLVESAEHV